MLCFQIKVEATRNTTLNKKKNKTKQNKKFNIPFIRILTQLRMFGNTVVGSL